MLASYARPEDHSFEELEIIFKEESRPVIIFVYTDWCKFCQIMKNTTFQE